MMSSISSRNATHSVKEIVAYGALKWRGRAVVSAEILYNMGSSSYITNKIGKFYHNCITEGLRPELIPLDKRGLARYASELIRSRQRELESLEQDKKDHKMTYIPRLLELRRKEQPKLDDMLDKMARSLPTEYKARGKILEIRSLLNERIMSLSDGLSEEGLEKLFDHSRPCELDENTLKYIKESPYSSCPSCITNTAKDFHSTVSGKIFHPVSENSQN